MSYFNDERDELITFLRKKDRSVSFDEIVDGLLIDDEDSEGDYAEALLGLVTEGVVVAKKSRFGQRYRLNLLDRLADL